MGTAGEASDTERSQAIVRVVLVTFGVIYMLMVPARNEPVIFDLAVGVSITSFLFLLAILRWPGVNHPRRALSMAHDYSAICIGMIFGGAALMPLYSLLLWVTMGNGLRYGPRYLIAATLAALLVLGVTTWFSPYWQEQSYVTITLVVTTIIVPAYSYSLVGRLHRAYDSALDANLAKSRFLAQASHDLRQPIHAIGLFTACLRDAGLSTGQRQMVDNIDKSLRSVAGLFRSLLDVSTLDSGRVTPTAEAVPLGEVIEEIVRQNKEAARWAGVSLRSVPTTLDVRVDRNLLVTMIQNIVSNALKYAAGRPVLIGCRRHGRTVAIEVHDKGNGIAPQHLPRLFDEFYQVRAPGDKDVEGVGLGLSIVQRLSQLMGLKVSLRSTVGRGTVVTIAGLPIAAAAPRAVRSESPVSATILTGLRVLLVEDDEAALAATASLLERWGCVVQAEAGMPAELAACDLVITDFDLGEGVTGSDCIARVRALAGYKVPAVVMTGHDESRVREYLGDPDIPILAKPVRPAELRSVVTAERRAAQSPASTALAAAAARDETPSARNRAET